MQKMQSADIPPSSYKEQIDVMKQGVEYISELGTMSDNRIFFPWKLNSI